MRRKKRALITGASGFVGGHLLTYLHKRGLEIWASYHRHKRRFSFPVRWIRADLTRFQEAVGLIQRSRPDTVFHFSGEASPRESWKNPGRVFQLNVAAPIFLFEGIVRFAPQARVVVVSSSHVYGTSFFSRKRLREEAVTNPLSPYGGSKLLMEMAARDYFTRHGLSVVIVRPFNQVGKGQRPNFVFSDFCRQVAWIEKGRRPRVLNTGNLDRVRDFVSVQDAVRAYDLLARRGKKGEIYNLGSGKGIQLREVVDFLKQESRVPFTVKKVSSRVQREEIPSAVADASKLNRLGWRPRERIWETLREILDEWRRKVGAN